MAFATMGTQPALASGCPGFLGRPLMADAFLMRRFATFARDLPLLLRVQCAKAAAMWLLRHHAPPFIVFA
jgi:hypothetical protein